MLKKIAIICIALFGMLLAVPTLVPSSAKYFPSWIKPIPLGLDLKGGAQLLLEVDTSVMMKEKNAQLYDEVRSAMIDRDKGVIRFSDLRNTGNEINITIREDNMVSKAKGRLRSVLGNNVDITSSGKTLTISYTAKARDEMISDAMSRSIEIVRRRIDALGTKEPSIQSQGGKYILVQLPGVDNPEHIKELIGQTAKMTFHLDRKSVV